MPTRRQGGGWLRYTDNIFAAQKVLRECVAPMHFKLVEARPSLIALHITYRDCIFFIKECPHTYNLIGFKEFAVLPGLPGWSLS